MTSYKRSLGAMRGVSPLEAYAGAYESRWFGQVVRGYLGYHAVPTNSQAIASFVHYDTGRWKRALKRCR